MTRFSGREWGGVICNSPQNGRARGRARYPRSEQKEKPNRKIAQYEDEIEFSGTLETGAEAKEGVSTNWASTGKTCKVRLSNPRVIVDDQHPGLSDLTYDVEIDGFGGGYIYEKKARNGKTYAIGHSVLTWTHPGEKKWTPETLFFSTSDSGVGLEIKMTTQAKAAAMDIVPLNLTITRSTAFNGLRGRSLRLAEALSFRAVVRKPSVFIY